MPKKLILFAMIIAVLITLLTACGGGTTTTASPVTTEKPTTSTPPVTTSVTTTPPTTTPPTTAPTTTPPTTTPPTTTPPTTSPVTTTPVETTTPPPTTTVSTTDADYGIASKMADFLFHIQLVQNYYADGLTALATFQVEETATKDGARDGSRAYRGIENVPPEFLKKLSASGAMPAEPGSCTAAAKPDVTFMTKGDKPVTAAMLEEKALESVPTEYVTVAQDQAGSLMSIIDGLVPMGDQSLATPEGWNTLLWDKLKEKQTPAESLMDYQLWNAAPDIETDIVSQYRETLVADGVDPRVLAAYDASDTHGWYANQEATDDDALARMEIVAEMTGSAQGTVYEHRDFSIPGAGDTPIYGDQTGEGIVTYNISDYGDVEFNVNIDLDKFDERGHAIGGTATGDAINEDFKGYQVVFTFNPLDGSKKGVVTKDGQEVGYLNMTVDQNKFENYIDKASGMEIPLPDDIQIPETTTPPA